MLDRRNIKEHALIGLLLGSDFLVGGLKNYGAAKIHTYLSAINIDDVVLDKLMELATSGLSKSVDEVSVFISAFTYELTNFEDNAGNFICMYPPPVKFPRYLAEYTNDRSKIEVGPPMKLV